MIEKPTRAMAPDLLVTIKKGGAFQALRNRNFRLLWIGQVGHSASMWGEAVARGWLIWELNRLGHSPRYCHGSEGCAYDWCGAFRRGGRRPF